MDAYTPRAEKPRVLERMRNKRAQIFLLYFLSYFLVLLIPITLGYVLYHRSVRTAEERELQSMTAILQHNGRLFDSRIGEVREMLDLVLLNEFVRNAFRDPHDAFHRYKAMRTLHGYIVGSRFVDNILIFFPDEDVLISGVFAVTEAERLYGTIITDEAANYAEWKAEVAGRIYTKEFVTPLRLMYNNERRLLDACRLSIPQAHSSRPGVLFALISRDEIGRTIDAFAAVNGEAAVMDADGVVLFSSGGPTADRHSLIAARLTRETGRESGHISHGKNIIIYTVLRGTGWIYAVELAKADVAAGTGVLKLVFLAVLAATVVVGGVASFVLATALGKPVGDTAQILSERNAFPPGRSGAIKAIRGSVEEVIRSNERLSVYIEENLPTIRDHFVRRILVGAIRNGAELSVAEENARLRITGFSYMAALVRIDAYRLLHAFGLFDELDRLKLSVRDRLSQSAANSFRAFAHEIESNTIAILFVLTDKETYEAAVEALRSMHDQVALTRRSFLCVGYGTKVDSPLDAFRSYAQAKHASEYAGRYGCRAVLGFSEIPDRVDSFRYPIESEYRLITLMKAADRPKTAALLEDLRAAHANADLGPESLRFLAEALRGTFLRVCGDPEVSDHTPAERVMEELSALTEFDSVDNLFARAQAIAADVCDRTDAAGRKSESALAEELRRYIDDGLFDPGFCFARFAEHFRMGEPALSRLFKELFGETFSHYVERLKMRHARSLLSEGVSVAEVARVVCYTTPQAFRRAYKRFFGELPGRRDGSAAFAYRK